MKKLSHQLKKLRRRLLRCYDDEDLHQLRIRLRRMRGHLKLLPGEQAHRLRRELGMLADTTNAARDWDTLFAHAAALLPPEQFHHLQPRLLLHRRAAHETVLAMLQSDAWTAAIRHWQQLEKDELFKQHRASDGSGQKKNAVRRARQRVDSARSKAMGKGSDRRWHKLRIAIKDLRYQLDETPKKARSSQDREIIAQCKQLQEYLGVWHDTVTHRRLLQELADSLDPIHHARAADALDILDTAIREEQDRVLAEVKTMLQQDTLLTIAPVTERM